MNVWRMSRNAGFTGLARWGSISQKLSIQKKFAHLADSNSLSTPLITLNRVQLRSELVKYDIPLFKTSLSSFDLSAWAMRLVDNRNRSLGGVDLAQRKVQ